LDVEKGEQVGEVQALLEHLRQGEQNALDQIAALPERAREKGERTDGEPPQHREVDGHGIRRVVSERADGHEQGRHQVALHREPLVGFVELLGEPGITAHQEIREVEQLHFLRHLVRGTGVAQVVEQAALRSPLEQQRVAQRRVVGLPEERRHHGDHEQDEEPRQLNEDHAGERRQRHQVLHGGEQQGDEADPAERLAARALEVVVGLGVLVLRQVERGGVLHQANTDAVRKQVAQQTFQQCRQAGQPLAGHADGELEQHQGAQVLPVERLASRVRAHGADHAVDDELADPQHRERNQRADGAQGENRRRVAAVRLEHELQQGWDVLQGLEPLGPARRLAVGAAARAPGTGHDTVRGETGRRRRHNLNFSTGRCVNITA
jgi:hypothetical protein